MITDSAWAFRMFTYKASRKSWLQSWLITFLHITSVIRLRTTYQGIAGFEEP